MKKRNVAISILAVALVLVMSIGLFAACSQTKYTVVFKNGDTEVSVIEIAKDGNIGEGNIPADPEAPAGKKFDGWFVGETKVDASYKVTGNVVATAKFSDAQASTYTVTFKNGDAVVQSVTKNAGSAIGTLPEGPQAPQGKQFDGWYVSGVKIDASYVVSANVDAIAQFSPIQAISIAAEYAGTYVDLHSNAIVEVSASSIKIAGVAATDIAGDAANGYTFKVGENNYKITVSGGVVSATIGNKVFDIRKAVTVNPDSAYIGEFSNEQEGNALISITIAAAHDGYSGISVKENGHNNKGVITAGDSATGYTVTTSESVYTVKVAGETVTATKDGAPITLVKQVVEIPDIPESLVGTFKGVLVDEDLTVISIEISATEIKINNVAVEITDIDIDYEMVSFNYNGDEFSIMEDTDFIRMDGVSGAFYALIGANEHIVVFADEDVVIVVSDGIDADAIADLTYTYYDSQYNVVDETTEVTDSIYAKAYFTVAFINGDDTLATEYVSPDTAYEDVTKPTDPEKAGFTFVGWGEEDDQLGYVVLVPDDYAIDEDLELVPSFAKKFTAIVLDGDEWVCQGASGTLTVTEETLTVNGVEITYTDAAYQEYVYNDTNYISWHYDVSATGFFEITVSGETIEVFDEHSGYNTPSFTFVKASSIVTVDSSYDGVYIVGDYGDKLIISNNVITMNGDVVTVTGGNAADGYTFVYNFYGENIYTIKIDGSTITGTLDYGEGANSVTITVAQEFTVTFYDVDGTTKLAEIKFYEGDTIYLYDDEDYHRWVKNIDVSQFEDDVTVPANFDLVGWVNIADETKFIDNYDNQDVDSDLSFKAVLERTAYSVKFMNGSDIVQEVTIYVALGKLNANDIPAVPAGCVCFASEDGQLAYENAKITDDTVFKAVAEATSVNSFAGNYAGVDSNNKPISATISIDNSNKVVVVGAGLNKMLNNATLKDGALYLKQSGMYIDEATAYLSGDKLIVKRRYYDANEEETLIKISVLVKGTATEIDGTYMAGKSDTLTISNGVIVSSDYYNVVIKDGDNYKQAIKKYESESVAENAIAVQGNGDIIVGNKVYVKQGENNSITSYYGSEVGTLNIFTVDGNTSYTFKNSYATIEGTVAIGEVITINYTENNEAKSLTVKINDKGNLEGPGAERGTYTASIEGTNETIILDGFGNITGSIIDGDDQTYIVVGGKIICGESALNIDKENHTFEIAPDLDGGFDGKYILSTSDKYVMNLYKCGVVQYDYDNGYRFYDGPYTVNSDGKIVISGVHYDVNGTWTIEENGDVLIGTNGKVYVKEGAQVEDKGDTLVGTWKNGDDTIVVSKSGTSISVNFGGSNYSAKGNYNNSVLTFEKQSSVNGKYKDYYTLSIVDNNGKNALNIHSKIFKEYDDVYEENVYDESDRVYDAAESAPVELDAFAGTWNGTAWSKPVTMVFDGKGHVQFNDSSMTYSVSGKVATFNNGDYYYTCTLSADGNTITVDWEQEDNGSFGTFTKAGEEENLDAFAGTWTGKVGANNYTVVCDGKGKININNDDYTYTIENDKIAVGVFTITMNGDKMHVVYDDGEFDFSGDLTKQ